MSSKLLELPDTATDLVDATFYVVQGATDKQAPIALFTKEVVGLGNVDNTSDADKPVSTATQTALDGKQDVGGATLNPMALTLFMGG